MIAHAGLSRVENLEGTCGDASSFHIPLSGLNHRWQVPLSMIVVVNFSAVCLPIPPFLTFRLTTHQAISPSIQLAWPVSLLLAEFVYPYVITNI